jgi:hypothetical protein
MVRGRRLLVNILLLVLIAWIGSRFIAPTIICWSDGGRWDDATGVCNLGTTVLEDQPSPIIGNEPLIYRDVVSVVSPRTGSRVTMPLSVSGSARGQWFFEGSFPLELLAEDGRSIARGNVNAVGEWMTTDFVPFKATLTLDPASASYQGAATLVLKKDNPSDDRSRDDSLRMPLILR